MNRLCRMGVFSDGSSCSYAPPHDDVVRRVGWLSSHVHHCTSVLRSSSAATNSGTRCNGSCTRSGIRVCFHHCTRRTHRSDARQHQRAGYPEHGVDGDAIERAMEGTMDGAILAWFPVMATSARWPVR
jgi:hypothetical protein